MAHSDRSGRSVHSVRAGFTIIEMLIVLAIGGVLMAIGAPALLNTVQQYKLHVVAQEVEILARQARYESIKRNQMVSVVPDTNHRMFYTIIGSPPPAANSFANGPSDIPAANRVAVLEVPSNVTFTAATFSFNPDGSATGGPATFSLVGFTTTSVSLATPATGKLITH